MTACSTARGAAFALALLLLGPGGAVAARPSADLPAPEPAAEAFATPARGLAASTMAGEAVRLAGGPYRWGYRKGYRHGFRHGYRRHHYGYGPRYRPFRHGYRRGYWRGYRDAYRGQRHRGPRGGFHYRESGPRGSFGFYYRY
jgi:hypothetical protein